MPSIKDGRGALKRREKLWKRTDVQTWNTRWSENCGFIGSSWLIVIVSVGPPFCTGVWEATGGNVPEEPAVTPKLSKSAAWHVLSHSPVRSGCGLSLAWWHCWVSWFWRCSCIHRNSNWSTEEYLSIDSIVAENVWRSMTTWRCFGGKL